MYIKEIKTRNKKNGKEYVKHLLVESIRTDKGPRARTVMQLGELTLPKELWPLLIEELESRISGQMQLSLTGIKLPVKVKNSADRAMEKFTIKSSKRVEKRKSPEPDEVTIKLEDTATAKHRSFGPEFVCHNIWNELDMPQKLTELGFSPRERSLAEGIVSGRLIRPGSELGTWQWLKNVSSIGELTEEELGNVGLSGVYKIGDKLLANKEEIERHLFKIQGKLHPNRETLYLFDLTNFYFEGQALGNSIAQYGKSKEKRNDCVLVSLGLIVDSSGFPVTSEIFPGNIGEPHTLSEILTKMKYFEDYLPGMAPTIVMDRGIATKDNVALLQEKNIPYILISRGPRNTHYLEEFENHLNDPEFKSIIRHHKEIYLKEVKNESVTEILCISEGRKEKEDAIETRWKERASEDLASLQKSILKGSIKLTSKIQRKLGRLEERYPSLSKYFSIELAEDKANPLNSSDLLFNRRNVLEAENLQTNPLNGTYVIETTLKEKSPEDIWSLYMTLTRVEEAFRCLKSELGTRPIFHQIARRTKGHLFISVIAYHLLATIEYKLNAAGDNRRWSTVCESLKTHQRSTVIITDSNNQIHHLRISSQPEACHLKIYEALKFKPLKKLKRYMVGKRL